MKFLLIADLHLGSRLDAWGDQADAARRELDRAWEEAVQLVTSPEEAIDGMLVAGDLFHSPEPETSVVERVTRGLERLVSSRKHVVLLPGIYDGLASPRSIYRRQAWPRGITVVDWCRPRVLSGEVGSKTLHLCTFAPLPPADSAPAAWLPEPLPPNGFRVGLFHAVTRAESPLAPWGPKLAPERLDELGLHLLIVGGDLHFREALWSATVMVSPGSLVPLRPRESEESAWTLATLSDAGVVIERRPRVLALDPGRNDPASILPGPLGARSSGGLRGAFLRIYENRIQETNDRELLEAALRYGLEELDRVEAPRVD